MASNDNAMILENEEPNFQEKYEFLLSVLPDADPLYLSNKCKEYYKNDDDFQRFILKSIKNKKYPTKKEYDRKLEYINQQLFYNIDFDIKKFVQKIPDPETHFSDANVNRRIFLANLKMSEKIYILTFLKNYFPYVYSQQITKVIKENEYDLLKSTKILQNYDKQLKTKRIKVVLSKETDVDIKLLQEIAYIEHRNEILSYIKQQQEIKTEAFRIAKNNNLLNSCECCFNEEVLPEETVRCKNGHTFCKDCTRKGCEIMFEQGKTDFLCLTTCDQSFDLNNLQGILHPRIFQRVNQLRQLDEINAAGLTDLEFCPSCDFAYTPVPEDKVFNCMNPDCLKKTCRLCRRPSHIPLNCYEVEDAEDVKLRTYIENKMTEALVRECYKCNRRFLKEDGCNKMTCLCGAKMCYVCKQPVEDYSHFNGQGGDKYDLCPLYSNIDKLHERNVMREVKKLKRAMTLEESSKLKIDPTRDIQNYYLQLKKKKKCSCGHCNH